MGGTGRGEQGEHAKGSSDSTGTRAELQNPVEAQHTAVPRSLIPPWNCSQGHSWAKNITGDTPKSSEGAGRGDTEVRASATKGGCETGGAMAQRGEMPSLPHSPGNTNWEMCARLIIFQAFVIHWGEEVTKAGTF